jgi:plastocyanin
MKRSRSLLGAAGLALVLAAPASAAEHVVQGQASLTWDRPDIAIAVGDTVTWQFADTTQNHNVQSQARDTPDATWNGFASPIAMPAPPASFTFNTDGIYTYVCIVHTSSMTGTVRVGNAGAPPPVPLSAQRFGNDDASVFPAEKVELDKTKPTLRSVSARRISRSAARVRFRVSEEAVVLVRVRRGGRTVQSISQTGTGLLGVNAKKLKPGRYSVEVRAVDLAGNVAKMRKVTLTVR